MDYLLIFIAGMLFYGVVIPLFNTILEYIETKKDVFVSNQSVIVSKNNSNIQKMQTDNEQPTVSSIGFECPSMDECEDDEYEEDNHARMSRKVGF